jgi:hypothetical protein
LISGGGLTTIIERIDEVTEKVYRDKSPCRTIGFEGKIIGRIIDGNSIGRVGWADDLG